MILKKTGNAYEPHYEPQIWGYYLIYKFESEIRGALAKHVDGVWHLALNKR